MRSQSMQVWTWSVSLFRFSGASDSLRAVKTSASTGPVRYYVCQKARQNGWHSCPTKSVPAGLIEESVVAQLRAALSSEETHRQLHISETDWQMFEQSDPGGLVRAVVERIAYDGITGAVTLTLYGNNHP